jgi:integrase
MYLGLKKEQKMTWTESIKAYLKRHSPSTAAMYGRGLARFRNWYVDRYEEEPDPELLTDEELRQWQYHLYEECKLAAATVNWHLSTVRGLARSCGNKLNTSDIKQVQPPIETLTARDLGRLIKTVDGDRWTDKRNVAMVCAMARAGLRVGEVVGLDKEDVTLRDRDLFLRQAVQLVHQRVDLGVGGVDLALAQPLVEGFSPDLAGLPNLRSLTRY